MPARGKKVKTGGKSRGAASPGRPKTRSSPRSVNNRSSPEGQESPAFTLRDAARSQHGPASWSSSLKLRHRAIGFVRSDEPKPLAIVRTPESIRSDYGTTDAEHIAPTSEGADAEQSKHSLSGTIPWEISNLPNAAMLLSLGPSNMKSPSSPSSPGSDASEDIVLFGGRNSRSQRKDFSIKQDTSWAKPGPVRVIDDPLPHLVDQRSNVFNTVGPITSKQWNMGSGLREAQPEPVVSRRVAKSSTFEEFVSFSHPVKPKVKHRNRGVNDLEAELVTQYGTGTELDDYIENIREGETLDELVDVSYPSETPDENDGWDSSDLKDFDELSTSEEVMESVQQILSRRQRPGGIQFLVVWEGCTVDDARWVPKTSLIMDGAATIIAKFEEKERHVLESRAASEDVDSEEVKSEEDGHDSDDDFSTGSDQDGHDSSDDDESGNTDADFEDDEDLIERRLARLSDEKLARLLTKQEELGLGSEELVIYDGMFADDDLDGGSDIELEMALHASRRRTKRRRNRSRRRLEFIGGFDDVMMLGEDDDDHGDFDIMDRGRSSIAGHSKTKDDSFLCDLSDTEQATTLRNAWAADRSKKKAKKQEREELRTQGLLGKKNKFKADLNAKYRDGMDVDQLREELRVFLSSAAGSRSLPPMDKRDRKMVHEIASAFGLKSLSKGSGKTRFTTLQKTSKTIDFHDESFARLRGGLEKRFYHRMDRKTGGSKLIRPNKGRGPGIGDAFSYKHGEAVGGTAPEIGADNRGHAMLQKMGWKLGQQLGGDNKGILTPIVHIVRSSRAGLG